MYTGSMVGSGAVIYAVWGYVIANMRPDKKVGAQVELNPKLLAFIIGETEKEITEAIVRLCAKDDRSRTKEEEGRRLVKLGEFDYQVVNGAKYAAIRNEEERREANRLRKAKSRMEARNGGGSARESLAVEEYGAGNVEKAEKLAEPVNQDSPRAAIPVQISKEAKAVAAKVWAGLPAKC
jgi:hypothetical protein